MNYFTFTDSPIGELLLTSDGHFLTGLYLSPHEKMELSAWQKKRVAADFSQHHQAID